LLPAGMRWLHGLWVMHDVGVYIVDAIKICAT
jgi:hypothetical protein